MSSVGKVRNVCVGEPRFSRTEDRDTPRDWALVELQSIVQPSRGIRYGIVQPGPYVYGGILLIRGQDYSDGWVAASDMYRVGAKIEARYENARVQCGDIIITIVGASTGHVEIIPKWLDGANLTQTTARIAIDEKKADSIYCKFVLLSSFGQRQVANYLKGGAQPGLNCGDIEKFVMPLPPSLEEQYSIAEVLHDADALIASLESLITKKRDLKQAAMQQLLTGKTRLPGFKGAWRPASFDEVLARVNAKRYQLQTANYSTVGTLPIIDQGQQAIVGFTDDASKRFECPRSGVIVFGDHTCIVKFVNYDFAVGADGTQVLSARPNQATRFHFYCLQYQGVPSTGYNRHYKQLRERPFVAPDFAEQEAIANTLSDMDAELAALEAKREKAVAIKQGMMQELLTGRIRLV